MNKKLQVFVSSTYTDLIEERQAAVQAILDAGHIPAGMELFKAGNDSQLKTIYKWIDESDVYMLILGGRYGTVEAKSGKSYTQLEYEYALSKNIPVFAVVLNESFLTKKVNSLGLTNVMEQKAPVKYQTFKSLVMSKLIREVDDCKDIKITIHSTLNDFIHDYDLVGWVRNLQTDVEILPPMKKSFDEIISIFKKQYFIFPASVLQSVHDLEIDWLSLFVFCHKFYSDYLYFMKSKNNPNAIKSNYLYRVASTHFLNFDLIKHDRIASCYQLTEFGKKFFIEVESKETINNTLIKELNKYYEDVIIYGHYACT